MKIVNAHNCSGMNMSIAQLWGSGPKFTVTCGECYSNFKERIQMVDYPVVKCPVCQTPNRLNLVINSHNG